MQYSEQYDNEIKRQIRKIQTLEQTEETLNDIFGLILQLDDFDEQYKIETNKWVRHQAKKFKSVSALDLIHKTYILGGRYSFDDYMVATEWNRVPKARFWIPRRKILEGKHHIATQIQEFIDDPKALYLGFSMPPGTGKSTLIKFLLAYIAGKFPLSTNMYVSYGDAIVKMMYDSVNSMICDSEYDHANIFPSANKLEVSAEYKTISYRRKGDFPTIGMVSLSGSVTGRTRANKFLVTDDLVKNSDEARSPERLQKLWENYNSTITTRTIGDNVKQIMLGTIWSKYDPISRMKAKFVDDERYKFIAIPVWDENHNSNFEYDTEDRYTKEKIEIIQKNLDPVDFSCLFLQQGIDKEGIAFPADQLKYYNGVLPDGEPDNIAFATDIAWGGGDSLSMPIAYIYGDDVYIHDVIFDKGDKFHTKPRVLGKILQHKCKMGRMEANNGGDEYCDDINKMLKQQGYSMNLTHKKAPTNMGKEARIEQHAPNIRNFYFRSRSCRNDEYEKFMEEVTSFSFTSKNIHDDAPDSLGQLVDFLYGGIKVVTTCPNLFGKI